MPEFQLDYAKGHFVCPECNSSTALYQEGEFTGWRGVVVSIDDEQFPVFETTGQSQSIDWDIETDGFIWRRMVGCSNCVWEGHADELVMDVPPKIGIDGHPLFKPIDGQLDMLTELAGIPGFGQTERLKLETRAKQYAAARNAATGKIG